MPAGFSLALGILLPLFFWLCHWQGWPFWWGGILLLPLALPRKKKRGGQDFSPAALLSRPVRGLLGLLIALLGLFALIGKDNLPLLYYPVLINLMMLCLFAASLWQKETLIERLARRLEPDLPESGVRYTRRVTQVWCLFFLLNGLIAWWSIGAGEAVWALYNGCIAYLLMALMFAGEWMIRRHVRKRATEESHV
jgi:uncharacterized membrane protein